MDKTNDNDEAQIVMDAMWNAIRWFENKNMLDEANKCRSLWNTMFRMRYKGGE
jgi:hypothetical protein